MTTPVRHPQITEDRKYATARGLLYVLGPGIAMWAVLIAALVIWWP